MRSIWLSKAIKKEINCKIIFFINKDSFSNKILKKHNIDFKFLKKLYPTSKQEAFKISILKPDLVIEDSPKTNNLWINEIKRNGAKMLSIISNKNSLNKSNFKLFPEKKKIIDTKYVKSGFNYSLLSPLYWNTNVQLKRKEIKNILITFGGCDHLNLTCKLLKILDMFKKKLKITVIIGKYYNNSKQIKETSKTLSHVVKLVNNPDSLFHYISKSDFVINGGGTTALEINNLQKPSLTMAIWKSQEELTKKLLNRKQYIFCFGKKDKPIKHEIYQIIKKNFEDKNFNFELNKKIDGKGCKRSAKWIKSLTV